jgi:hypothetical protein
VMAVSPRDVGDGADDAANRLRLVRRLALFTALIEARAARCDPMVAAGFAEFFRMPLGWRVDGYIVWMSHVAGGFVGSIPGIRDFVVRGGQPVKGELVARELVAAIGEAVGVAISGGAAVTANGLDGIVTALAERLQPERWPEHETSFAHALLAAAAFCDSVLRAERLGRILAEQPRRDVSGTFPVPQPPNTRDGRNN